MSRLYPRLLPDQAAPLHQAYRDLPPRELAAHATTRHDSAVYVATGGDRVTDGDLQRLRERVLALARDTGFPEESTRTARARFDLDLAAVLHAEMGLMPAEAAAGDMWAFLALIVLPDVAYWRYPRPPRDRVLATDITRHVFGRLWWRAQLVHDAGSPTPYAALEILGEAAFDQIYARRKALGGSPHLVRGILRVWNTLDLTRLNERDLLRDFLKRLLRLAPFVLFEALENDGLDAELRIVAAESVAALRDDDHESARQSEKGHVEQSESPTTEAVVAPHPTAAPASPKPYAPVPPQPFGPDQSQRLASLDVCAGAGGLALGLENAGFAPILLIDHRAVACESLRRNRPDWDVREIDLCAFDPTAYRGRRSLYDLDLISAGLPRLKAAAAVNRERGNSHELEALQTTIALVQELRPRAVLIENVPELVTSDTYESIRRALSEALSSIGYGLRGFVLNAADHGVPQERKQGVVVALRGRAMSAFREPVPSSEPPLTVGKALGASMAARGWADAERWSAQADRLAPTIVGGSWERGGPDLGPTGSKETWARMGVDGGTVADDVPGPDFRWDPVLGRTGMVPLTVEQAACLQGFPKDWQFAGRKTARYRQVGHASPPPVGEALGRAIRAALRHD